MSRIYGASGAARHLTEQIGRTVRGRDVSDLLYEDEGLRAKCPLVGRSRGIPAEVLPELRRALETRPAKKPKTV